MRHYIAKIYIIAQELFQFSLITYLLLIIAEFLKEGFISRFLDTNIVLVLVVVSGIIMNITYIYKFPHDDKVKKFGDHIQNSFFFAMIGAMIVWYKTKELGNISYLIIFITAFSILAFSILLFLDEE